MWHTSCVRAATRPQTPACWPQLMGAQRSTKTGRACAAAELCSSDVLCCAVPAACAAADMHSCSHVSICMPAKLLRIITVSSTSELPVSSSSLQVSAGHRAECVSIWLLERCPEPTLPPAACLLNPSVPPPHPPLQVSTGRGPQCVSIRLLGRHPEPALPRLWYSVYRPCVAQAGQEAIQPHSSGRGRAQFAGMPVVITWLWSYNSAALDQMCLPSSASSARRAAPGRLCSRVGQAHNMTTTHTVVKQLVCLMY